VRFLIVQREARINVVQTHSTGLGLRFLTQEVEIRTDQIQKSKMVPAYLRAYSCCSHLQHMASVKYFVLLQFLNLRQELLGRGIRTTQGRYIHRTTQTQKSPLSGIRTHDPSVREGKDISCLRSRGHCDRHP
jgi:hypothetical protein